ncbi:Oligosaccharide translocation protein RFT1 [Ceratocystis lukuohia]|uniref:Man(5)GlcNAc(2)-PP-dolichol translocation protein RFT1 n=1 Tax=Ceratocystis lukuohia TaxID=2019550 RepID=A0ABR4MI44_9PEZI
MSSRGAVFRGGLFLFLQQLLSRGLTFAAGQVLLRFLTAQKLGLATQLEVYYLSILFFARESLRVAAQRQPIAPGPSLGSSSGATPEAETRSKDTSQGHSQHISQDPSQGGSKSSKAEQPRSAQEFKMCRSPSQTAINLGYIAVPLGAVVALVFGAMFRRVSTAADFVPLALNIYGMASLIELAAEPFFALLAARQQFGARARAESAAAIARCIGTLGAAYWASRAQIDIGVLPFAAGQLAYGIILWCVYVLHVWPLARDEGFSLLPRGGLQPQLDRREQEQTYVVAGLFYKPAITLAASLQAQGIVKHFLTQGDTLIVSVLASPVAQGVYALANNYGGLVARLVFQPVEEMSRNYFGRLLAIGSVASVPSKDGGTEKDIARSNIKENDGKAVADRKVTVSKAAHDLAILLKIYLLFSTIVVAIGPVAAPPAIEILAGTRWAADGAGDVLARYCYYIPLLALNGLTEAFVSSVATEKEVHSQSLWMTMFSAVFGAAGYFFLEVADMQASGLVFANIVNMACRIVWSCAFISRYFLKEGVRFDLLALRPGIVASVACVGAPHVIRITAQMLLGNGVTNPLMRLAAMGVAAVPVVLAM